MKDIRQTKKYASYLKRIGWNCREIDSVQVFTKEIFGLINITKIQRPEKINKGIIKEITSQKGINITIVEPKDKSQSEIIKKMSFKQTKPYLPSKTLIINLNRSIKEILKQTKKDCRYSIKKTEKLKFIDCNNKNQIDKFQKAWKKSVNLKRYVPPTENLKELKKAFGKNSLFLLHQKNKSVSGAIFLKTNNTAYYWQAFTNKKARKELVQYQIVWQGIKWAKKNGCVYFDFEGIFDKRFQDKSWLGFTHFKKSFGGKEKKYPGAFMKISLNLF